MTDRPIRAAEGGHVRDSAVHDGSERTKRSNEINYMHESGAIPKYGGYGNLVYTPPNTILRK